MFFQIQTVLGVNASSSQLLPLFVQLLKDGESEVRAAISAKLYEFAKHLSVETQRDAIVLQIIPELEVAFAVLRF